MKKLLTLAMFGIVLALAHNSSALIIGPPGGCVGTTTTFMDSLGSSSGVWSSSNTSIATIDPATGVISAISAGTVTISYLDGSTLSTLPFTVSPVPASITGGPTTLCIGGTASFADATSGGTWMSSYPYVMTVSATGVATGAHLGTAYVNYYTGPGCMASLAVTVSSGPSIDSILGAWTVCTGSTTTFTDVTPGGTWSSSNPSIATVSSSGVVTGVSSGVAIISYTASSACGSATATRAITVTSTTSPGSITGTTSVSAGATTSLFDATGGGTWSSSNTSIATVSASGVVTGVAVGTCTISCAVTGCSGTAYATTVITVTAFDGISGHALFGGVAYYGPVKVWLIHYDPATLMLTATDSVMTYSTGASAFYQFTGVATDSFRVKAATDDSFASTVGYIPTYHTSSAYWNTATVIPHVSGTSDINKDINMGYGATTAGPGFIAGDVTTGANKGSSGTIPAPNLLIYAENEATGAILQKTYTDASGHYSFNNLPVGQTYRIYPELLNYGTTPFTAISLTSATPSMMAASFVQHTVSHTITPITTAIGNVTESVSYINAFPNPTSGKVTLNWNAIAKVQANVSVTDVTGRQVYTSIVNMNKGAGAATLDLSELNNGLYMISVKSESVNYNSKIQIIK